MSQFISTTMTMMIRGVCNESLFGDVCQQPSCDLLHLRAPVPVTDGHFHQRLLRENWFDRLALIKNVEEFIGINNNHQAFDWDQPLRPIPEGLASKVMQRSRLVRRTFSLSSIIRSISINPMVFILAT